MYRGPARPPRSPGPPARFPSPASCWRFPGPRSPYGASEHHGGGGGGGGAFSPRFTGSHRGYRGSSLAGFGGASRGCGGQMWRRRDGFQPGCPGPLHNLQVKLVRTFCSWRKEWFQLLTPLLCVCVCLGFRLSSGEVFQCVDAPGPLGGSAACCSPRQTLVSRPAGQKQLRICCTLNSLLHVFI